MLRVCIFCKGPALLQGGSGGLCRQLPPSRQQALQRTLEAAANQMTAAERRRAGPGPPPLISLVQAVRAPEHLQPQRVDVTVSSPHAITERGLPGSISPFIYNPYKEVCAAGHNLLLCKSAMTGTRRLPASLEMGATRAKMQRAQVSTPCAHVNVGNHHCLQCK
jgi:hypothetical protein